MTKKDLINWCGRLATVSLFSMTLVASDMPVFYRAPLLQEVFPRGGQDWQTRLAVFGGTGSRRSSWTGAEDKVPLFSVYGPVNIMTLGYALQAPKTQTKALWSIDATGAGAGKLGSNTNPLGINDGMIDINGRVRTDQLSIMIEQAALWGFYAQVQVPVRRLRLDSVNFTNRGAQSLSLTSGTFDVKDFLTNTTTGLPAVLQEAGFATQLDYHKTTVSEVLVAAGWRGETEKGLGMMVTSVHGSAQAAVIIPAGGKAHVDQLFSIPVGYDGHWGVQAELAGEIGFWEKLAFGVRGQGTIFFKDDRQVRLKTATTQRGWINLEKVNVNVDLGSLWQAFGYVKAHQIFGGFSAALGYSFTHQEATRVNVRDDNYLKDYVAGPLGLKANPYPMFINKDFIANSDDRLKSWEQQVLHLFGEYDVRAHTNSFFAPSVAVEYSYPILGRRSFRTAMLGGGITLHLRWHF